MLTEAQKRRIPCQAGHSRRSAWAYYNKKTGAVELHCRLCRSVRRRKDNKISNGRDLTKSDT